MSKKPNRVVQYRQANEAFLEQKSKEDGMIVLDSGIVIKVLEEGTGTRRPALNSMVYVSYTGRLIDGSVFDTTEGSLPACFKVRDLIVGWQAALLRMTEGETIELYVPAKYGYGSMKLDGIPAWSTLVFNLTLVKIL